MSKIKQLLFRIWAWVLFYLNAVTKYQIHSSFVFQWMMNVLEDRRNYYSFGAINQLRNKMLDNNILVQVTDFGAGPNGALENKTEPTLRQTTLHQIAQSSGSTARQGEMLFKLAQLHQPKFTLELGTSVGLSTLYLALGAGSKTNFISLEGCPKVADIARLNLRTLGVKQVNIITGAFEKTLENAVQSLERLDLVYFDGNHQEAATLRYFNICLPKAHHDTVFIFDDVHWSVGMEAAWKKICGHDRVTLSIDCGHFACAYFNPEFKIKQHFKVVRYSWKPWKVY